MIRLLALLSFTLFAACDDGFDTKANRKVVSLVSPAGQAFHFMPIYEKGVSDITFRLAFPTNWSREAGRNPAVPFVGSDLILSGGTAELKPQDVLETFNELNARGSLDATADYVFGELEAPKESIETALAIASEMLARPQLNLQWMERIKQNLLEDERGAQARSDNRLTVTARRAILGDTPIFQGVSLSELSDIPAITADDIRTWHADTFTQAGVVIAVTGAISPEDAGRLVDVILSGLPEGEDAASPDDAVDWTPRVVLLHRPEAEKTTLGLRGRLPSSKEAGDEFDFVAVNLLGGANGPIFEALRTDLRASYAVNVGYHNYTRDIRLFVIQSEVETTHLAQARDVALAAYEAYRTAPDFTGFEELQGKIVNGTQQNVGYVNVAARLMVELVLDGKDPAQTPRLHEVYDAITEADVAARLRDHFPAAEDLLIIAVSPDATALPGACVITAIEQVDAC